MPVISMTPQFRASLRDGLILVRLMLALDMLGWALILAGPRATFASSHSYDIMASWMSERTWTLVCALGFVAMVLVSRRSPRPLRIGAGTISILFQGALCISFAFGPAISTGLPAHLLLGVMLSYWVTWREATDA